MQICPVILCGGVGSRLWPLSRRLYPKQFMDLGGHSLFADTLARVAALAHCTPPLVICNQEQRFLAAAQMQDLGVHGTIILEPQGRNTAPAIAVAAYAALGDAVAAGAGGAADDVLLLVLPSDHAIRQTEIFVRAVQTAATCAATGKLVTFGIEPRGPETGYGYIEAGMPLSADLPRVLSEADNGAGDGSQAAAFSVRRFVEKPARAQAEAMLAQGGYYWNSGMFLFRASAYLAALERYASPMAAASRTAWEQRRQEYDFIWLGEAFAHCPADSIDYAVMEKTDAAAVVPLAAAWSDLGSWQSLYEAAPHDADNNVCVGDVLSRDVQGCYLHASNRLVAALGLQDTLVVETGDAVLVAPVARSQEVKQLVEELAHRQRAEMDTHLRVYRPWGWYETLALGPRFQVKRIQVKSGAALSLQLHQHRAEHWVVVSGTGEVTVGDKVLELHENQSTFIPVGVKHRLVNRQAEALEIIEVQSGSYLGEDDIVRFDDTYGRC